MSKRNTDFDKIVTGPNGETIKINWMPDKRVRFDFKQFGKVAVTDIFAAKLTKVEVNYTGE